MKVLAAAVVRSTAQSAALLPEELAWRTVTDLLPSKSDEQQQHINYMHCNIRILSLNNSQTVLSKSEDFKMILQGLNENLHCILVFTI